MAALILSILLALVFLATGGGKVLNLAFSQKLRDGLHVPSRFWRATGALEWAGALGLIVGIWVPLLGLLAAIGLALLMVGAIVTRVRSARIAGTPRRQLLAGVAADAVVLALVVVTAILIAQRL